MDAVGRLGCGIGNGSFDYAPAALAQDDTEGTRVRWGGTDESVPYWRPRMKMIKAKMGSRVQPM